MTTEARFCSQCGKPLPPGSRFCSQCGAPVVSSQPSGAAAPQPASTPASQTEPIVDVIPLQQRGGFMGMSVKSFNLIVTPQRLVLLPISRQEMQEAVKTARERARAAGKGFFGQWGAQLAWMQVLYERYRTTPVDNLARTPGSTVIWNQEVRSIRLKDSPVLRMGSSDEMTRPSYPTMNIETSRGNFKFELLTMKAGEARKILQQTLGGSVR